ncbi:NifB/NifX family molybdenum-iron cluster-binding protein [bacterium]
MKIAITAIGTDLSSEIDQRFGRAKNIIIVDTETMEFSCIENTQNLNAASGAGIQTSQNVAKQNVEVVLTGNCGPKAFATLQAAGIKVVIGVTGSIKDAIEDYKNGKLKISDSANVEGHW